MPAAGAPTFRMAMEFWLWGKPVRYHGLTANQPDFHQTSLDSNDIRNGQDILVHIYSAFNLYLEKLIYCMWLSFSNHCSYKTNQRVSKHHHSTIVISILWSINPHSSNKNALSPVATNELNVKIYSRVYAWFSFWKYWFHFYWHIWLTLFLMINMY